MTTSTPQEPASSATQASTPPPSEPEVEIWAGDIAGQMIEFQFVVDAAGTVNGLVKSPSEGGPDVPINGVVTGSSVTIKIPAADAMFEGEVDGTTMTGTRYQSGAEIPAAFELRDTPLILARPQEPTPPFPYEATDVRFENGETSLAGTLVVPKGEGPFPAVVLSSGSGSQDRDETIV